MLVLVRPYPLPHQPCIRGNKKNQPTEPLEKIDTPRKSLADWMYLLHTITTHSMKMLISDVLAR